MRIAEVIGTVTLSCCHPTMKGASYRLAVPMRWSDLSGETTLAGEALVVYDDLGSSNGSRIAVSEGGEAAQPFPEDKPVDAYNGAILDQIEVISAADHHKGQKRLF